MSATQGRQTNSQLRRLQTLLLLMLLWDLFAALAALSFGSALMNIDGDEVGGLLAAKATFSGAAFVPAAVYLYGLVRNPLRHPGVLWVGVVEHGASILAAAYHVGANDITPAGAALTVVVSIVFLVLLLANMPRGDTRA